MVGITCLLVFIGRSRLFFPVSLSIIDGQNVFVQVPGVSSSPNVLGIAFFLFFYKYIMCVCVCVSLVCGKKRRRWRRKTVNVTRWHFWNNKVTACRWQLSLVLSLSDLCGNYCAILPYRSTKRRWKETEEKIPRFFFFIYLSFLLVLVFMCMAFFFRLFSLDQTRNEQRWSTNERMNADIYSAIEGCST